MKKILKILVGILILLLSILIITPYFFEDKIVEYVKTSINKNINAKVDFEDVDISLISNFPNVKVSLNNLLITTFKPFEGDTLASVKSVSLKMPLASLFKIGSGKIDITYFSVEESIINILINEQGVANYDITKESNIPNNNKTTEESNSLTLSLNGYQILNATIRYFDSPSQMYLELNQFNHSGSGNLSSAISELKTKTNTKVSFEYNKETYLNNNSIDLDAIIGIDLNKSKYTFLDNKALINQLPLIFDGFIQINKDNQELDISFRTPSSDFKNFLALIPEAYSKDISGVKTTGNFMVEGFAKGIIDDTHIPKFDIQFTSDNASFKYPDLPKSINNINLSTSITNKTGITNDTEINIKKLSFKIDDHIFSSNAFISNLVENPKVKAKAKGTINLNSISQAYPMEEIKELQGILKSDFEASFDMNSIEQKNYKNIKNSGTLSISDFKYEGDETANPIEINNAQVTFNSESIVLNNFEAKTGNSDLKMNGSIKNLIGFVFNNENIEGDFNLKSNNFDVSDFMEIETPENEDSTDETVTEQLKIPSFLDCTINVSAATVVYDNLNLKNVKGNLTIKDEKATLNNLSSSLFDGKLILDGMVSTKEDTPTFSLKLDITEFDIFQSFSQLELFGALAPIGNLIKGKINTDLNISGSLNNDLSPNLSTVSGDALSEILTSNTSLKNSKVMSLLSSNLSFINLDKLNLDHLKTKISFENGKVNIKPFNIKYENIDIEISGKHGFDQTMDYKLNFDLPAKYLGSEVSKLLASLSEQEIDEMTVPVSANILGSFSNPTVKTNMNKAVSDLTNQIIAKQKDKLVEQGSDELIKLLGGNTKSKDSTKTDPTTEAAKSLINSFFKKKKDTNN